MHSCQWSRGCQDGDTYTAVSVKRVVGASGVGKMERTSWREGGSLMVDEPSKNKNTHNGQNNNELLTGMHQTLMKISCLSMHINNTELSGCLRPLYLALLTAVLNRTTQLTQCTVTKADRHEMFSGSDADCLHPGGCLFCIPPTGVNLQGAKGGSCPFYCSP